MTPCPVCGHPGRPTRLEVTTIRPYRVERCTHCRLAYTTPRPTPEELAEVYSERYFTGAHDGIGYRDYGGQSWGAANAARMWRQLHTWEPRLGRVPHSLLDVGCATGEFAASARDAGWEASGVEVSDTARHAASARGVHTATTLDAVDGPFGLITMFHVLEHMIEPLPALARARRLLAADGLLVIELPQWGSLGRRVRGAKWSQLRPPEHINFFNTRSLRAALSATGWGVVRSASIYPQLIDRSVEALQQRKALRALAYGGGALALERADLGGYLRVIASPT